MDIRRSPIRANSIITIRFGDSLSGGLFAHGLHIKTDIIFIEWKTTYRAIFLITDSLKLSIFNRTGFFNFYLIQFLKKGAI
jgi:hypothetical protein